MSDDERRRVGARIRQARKERGLTQVELAKLLGITTRSIQNYESGAIVPYRHLRLMELVTHRSAAWLLEGGDLDVIEDLLAKLHAAIERHSSLLRDQEELLTATRELQDHWRRQPDTRAQARAGG